MKYKKEKQSPKKAFGSLINKGTSNIAKTLGASDKTANLIGSGLSTATGFIPGMQANLMQAGDLISDVGEIAGDESGITENVGQLASMSAPFMMGYGGSKKTYNVGGMLTEFQEGGTHEQNPNGGIPLGKDALVEEKETMDGDFIFSERLKVNKQLAEEFNLPKKAIGKSFAEVSKMFDDTTRVGDNISKRAYTKDIENLKVAQESFKEVEGLNKPTQQMSLGGPKPPEEDPLAWENLMNNPLDFASRFQQQPVIKTPNDNLPTQAQIEGREAVDKYQFPNSTQVAKTPKTTGVNQTATTTGVNQTPPTTSSNRPTLNIPQDASSMEIPTEDPTNVEQITKPNSLTDDSNSSGFDFNSLSKYGTLARFAPVVTSAINLAQTAKNKPTPKDPAKFQTNERIDENFVDMEQVKRGIESQGEAVRTSMRDNAGGRSGALASNLIGSQLATQQGVAQADIQGQSINNQERARVQNARLQQEFNNRGIALKVEDLNDRDRQAWFSALMDSTSEFGNNLGAVGSDIMSYEIAKNMPINYLMSMMGQVNKKSQDGR